MSSNPKTVEGIFRDGRVELLETPDDVDEARVIVTFLPEGAVNLSERGIDEAQAVVSVGEGFRVDVPGRQTDCDGENQGAVGDALTEFLSLTPLSIHVMRIKITALAGVQDDVSFGYSPTQCFAG